MKVRTDFVSNSSSCSFVIGRTDSGAVEGLRLLAQVLGNDYDLEYEIESEFNITLTVLRKNAKLVNEFISDGSDLRNWEGDWDDYSQYFSSFSYDAREKKDDDELRTNVSFGMALKIGKSDDMLGLIESAEFRCEDSSRIGVMYLGLLYRFFERNECCPDPGETEQDFLNSCFSDMARKLAAACVGKPGKKTKRKKT